MVRKRVGVLLIMILLMLSFAGCSTTGVSFNSGIDASFSAKEQAIKDSKLNNEKSEEKAKKEDERLKDEADEDYDEVMEQYAEGNASTSKMAPTELVLYYLYMFVFTIKKYMWGILVFLWAVGFSLFFFANGNRRLKKEGLVLALGGSVVVLLISFATAIQSMFSI